MLLPSYITHYNALIGKIAHIGSKRSKKRDELNLQALDPWTFLLLILLLQGLNISRA